MKTAHCLFTLLTLALVTARAGEAKFPGLQAIMSEADWKRARLDRLDAADLRLVNEAFAQFLQGTPTPRSEPVVTGGEAPPAVAKKRPLWERFGLPQIVEKTSPAKQMMQAKVTALHGTNGFVLDNAQVWVGLDPIRDELIGHNIGIVEGRFGAFLLVVDGQETNVRLHRVR
jgi:hypothetical protein